MHEPPVSFWTAVPLSDVMSMGVRSGHTEEFSSPNATTSYHLSVVFYFRLKLLALGFLLS
jgi:hypothetical protein